MDGWMGGGGQMDVRRGPCHCHVSPSRGQGERGGGAGGGPVGSLVGDPPEVNSPAGRGLTTGRPSREGQREEAHS
jgi:hypothetical protein